MHFPGKLIGQVVYSRYIGRMEKAWVIIREEGALYKDIMSDDFRGENCKWESELEERRGWRTFAS